MHSTTGTEPRNQIKQLQQRIKVLEGKLAEHEQMLHSIADGAPDVICRFDRNFQHLYVNPALERATGIPVERFIGNTPHEAGLPKPMADFWVAQVTNAFSQTSHLTIEFAFPTPIGERQFQSLLVPELDDEGKPFAVLSWTRDVTEFKEKLKQKDEIFGIVSHELKSPLTSLKTFTQLLHRTHGSKDATQHSEYLEKMNKQINRVNRLINDLLGSTEQSEGLLEFHETEFDFNELAREIVLEMQDINPERTIETNLRAKHLARADRQRITQVLTNLISNAIKYSPEHTRILVSTKSDRNRIICAIQDFGRGIPADQKERIFERYYRIPQDKNGPSGLGLGLFITKEILTASGGQIWVESEEGKGSTFCFTLPMASKIKASQK